jgi:hypothetical protein
LVEIIHGHVEISSLFMCYDENSDVIDKVKFKNGEKKQWLVEDDANL